MMNIWTTKETLVAKQKLLITYIIQIKKNGVTSLNETRFLKKGRMKRFMEKRIMDGKDFSYYSGYFHDGALLSITNVDREIIFEMESFQIYACENRDLLPLSEDNTIYGQLHAQEVISIKNYGTHVDSLQIEYEYGDFMDCEISETRIYLTGTWHGFGPKRPKGNPVFDFEVIAKKVYWENTANIKDPALLGKYMGLEGRPPYGYPQWYIDNYGPQNDE